MIDYGNWSQILSGLVQGTEHDPGDYSTESLYSRREVCGEFEEPLWEYND